jgi:lysophospholipase L1-like esterase
MFRKLALAAASALLSLALLELALRVTGLELHDRLNDARKYGSLLALDEAGDYFRHPAGTSVRLQGVILRFNSFGMRDDEPRIPKPSGLFRILCLGDSMTLGPGVPQDKIYPARLRALLAGEAVDVVAAGVGGWNSVEEEHFLARNIDRLEPDLVLLLYVTNDAEPIPPYRRERQPATRLSTRLYRTLVLRSRLFEWGAYVYATRVGGVNRAALRDMAQWGRERGVVAAPFTAEDAGWTESLAALGRMRAATRAHGARLVIFLYNMGNFFPAPTVLEGLRAFGAREDVPVFDTWSFFAGRDLKMLVNGVYDPHPNAPGHALLAEGITRTLRAEGLLPRVRAAAGHPS